MSLDYTGVYNAAQTPSSAPSLGGVPIFRLPVSGDPVAVATSLYQWAKATADGLAYSWRSASGGYLAAVLARATNVWTGIQFFGPPASPDDAVPGFVLDVTGGVTYKLLYRTYDSAHPLNPEICVYECMDTLIGPVGSLVTAVNAVYTSGVGWACQDITNAATLVVQGYGVIASYSHIAQMAPWADGAWVLLQSTAVTTGNFFVKGTGTFNDKLDAPGSVKASRYRTSGTTLATTNFSVTTSGVGSAKVDASGTDQMGRLVFTTGITPDPTTVVLLTFANGTWTTTPYYQAWAYRTDTGAFSAIGTVAVATTAAFTFDIQPAASTTYVLLFTGMGT